MDVVVDVGVDVDVDETGPSFDHDHDDVHLHVHDHVGQVYPPSRVKVLIADDDRLVRAMVRDLLAELGHAAVEAANGVEAVATCERERPDLLILDLLMPKLSGLDALEQLRARGVRAPAILLSAISGGSVRALDGAQAVDVLLEKPVTQHSLARAIARATRGGKAP